MYKYISQITLIIVLAIWQLSDLIFQIPEFILPSPFEIMVTIYSNFHILLIHTSFTLVEAVLGILVAIIIGVLIAIGLFKSKLAEQILVPYINVLQTIPAIVIAPLFAMWFGFGLFPKVLLIVIFCSFPIIISSLSSFKQVSDEDVLYMRTIGANNYQLFKHLYLPVASKSIFASIKISTTYALVNAIFAEYMGAKYGLGVYLNRAASSFDTSSVFAVIVVIIVVTLTMLKIVDIIEKRIIKWS